MVPNPENIPDGVSEPRQAPIPRSRPGVKERGKRKEFKSSRRKEKKIFVKFEILWNLWVYRDERKKRRK